MFDASWKGTGRKILWQELWRHEFLQALEQDPVVLVPVGSVEQHGPHCPADVDISVPWYAALEVARRVEDFPVVVAPPVWSGVSHYNMGFPGTLSVRLETFQMLLADVLRSVHANAFRRIVVINGHGGNSAPSRAVCCQVAEEDIFALAFNWWDVVAGELEQWGEADRDVGHGGEWETSVQLHLRAHLVDLERRASDQTGTRPFVGELAFAEFAERRRDTAHGTGVMGNALVASAQKGRPIFDLLCRRLESLVQAYHLQPVRHYRELGSHCP